MMSSRIVAGAGIPALEGYFLEPSLQQARGGLALSFHWARKDSTTRKMLTLWLLRAAMLHADVVLLPLYIPGQLAFPRLSKTIVEPLGRRHSKLTLVLEQGSISLSFVHAAHVEEITDSVRVYTPEQLKRGEIHPDDWL